MPVECHFNLLQVEQNEFHEVDYQVMRHVFDIHNTFGRFCEEKIYQDELAERCRNDNLHVNREAHIRVWHKHFSKSYYLDLLINAGIIYELKAVSKLAGQHQMQLINYLLLTNVPHGKLINYRPYSVETRFVSSRLKLSDRKATVIDDSSLNEKDIIAQELRELVLMLLNDWGAFLEVELYREAMLALLSCSMGVQSVEISHGSRMVGNQKMCILKNNAAWHISSIRSHQVTYEQHLFKLFMHTKLDHIHWINLNGNSVTMKTLTK